MVVNPSTHSWLLSVVAVVTVVVAVFVDVVASGNTRFVTEKLMAASMQHRPGQKVMDSSELCSKCFNNYF